MDKIVLDACCGPRMFWFERADPRAVFVDVRRETHTAADFSITNGERQIVVDPDIIANSLPFDDESFALVVFDPIFLEQPAICSLAGDVRCKLIGDWQDMLRHGFDECFRVLRPDGVLIFKWSETQFPVSQILALAPECPLFGQRCGKTSKTHWIVFMKPRSSE